ncbi:MAG: phosphoribosylamine--glycine ligase, partial [Candidatus Diapherotrites archaeon]|nr:phosphoribosylamine--glycine ligase [Candidatus Diapherotrites archaeon]
MKVLVVGSGGREHTIGWKAKQSPKVNEVYFAPGNAGTSKIGVNVNIKPNEFQKLADFVKGNDIELTIIGPEDPLANGIVDYFQQQNLRAFGPNKKAAQMEASKGFFKQLMKENQIPTAGYEEFTSAEQAIQYVRQQNRPLVVKADGLAAGKGVILCETTQEAENAVRSMMQDKKFGNAGNKIVIEEFLRGEEASIIAFTDGKTIKTLTPSQDHKLALDGDQGLNTGGMGAYAPAPIITPNLLKEIKEKILKPTVTGLAKKGIEFKGILYAGLMITKEGPKILEYNVRLGDPETQVILPLMKSDLIDIINACIDGNLENTPLELHGQSACCVILASGGYPESYEKGKEIRGLTNATNPHTIVFHAGTKLEDGKTVTSGGRVLGVTALGDSIKEAISKAYETVNTITFDKMQYRKDIGHRALKREPQTETPKQENTKAHKLEIRYKKEHKDPRDDSIKRKIKDYLNINITNAAVIDNFTIDANLTEEQLQRVQKEIFTDPITQNSSYKPLTEEFDFDYVIEVGYLPGAKDNAGETSAKAIEDLLKTKLNKGEAVYTSRQYLLKGDLNDENVKLIGKDILANEMIEHWKILSHQEVKEKGLGITIPKVVIPHEPTVENVSLNLPDDQLEQLSKDRSIALSLGDMKVIKAYYDKPQVQEQRRAVGLTEKPTDIELEVIGQTQSEHCKHRIFNAKITYEHDGKTEEIDSLFDTYIRKSSKEIEATKDWIISTFWDNAGVLTFDDTNNYVVKCETHNSPSALDPYGGAITGIVGVYRDPMGTGMGAKIVAGTYGFCTASPFYEGDLLPRMHPRRLLEGIAEGVMDGGNKSGVPTPYGITFFDQGWIGKPLVYVTAIGIMPKEIKGEPSHTKQVDDGDLIVMAGGRVGKDGIHGVTESSMEHGTWITAGHVQIGDPFTQKKMHDFILEARDKRLFKLITDNGGGGLSSSLGETSEMSNGADIQLDKIPLKYEGLDPWEILVSESQERMTLGVHPRKIEELKELAEKHAVEITVIGTYKNTGKFHITYNGKTIAYLDEEFLHGGFPQYQLQAKWQPTHEEEPDIKDLEFKTSSHEETLKRMLGRENIA